MDHSIEEHPNEEMSESSAPQEEQKDAKSLASVADMAKVREELDNYYELHLKGALSKKEFQESKKKLLQEIGIVSSESESDFESKESLQKPDRGSHSKQRDAQNLVSQTVIKEFSDQIHTLIVNSLESRMQEAGNSEKKHMKNSITDFLESNIIGPIDARYLNNLIDIVTDKDYAKTRNSIQAAYNLVEKLWSETRSENSSFSEITPGIFGTASSSIRRVLNDLDAKEETESKDVKERQRFWNTVSIDVMGSIEGVNLAAGLLGAGASLPSVAIAGATVGGFVIAPLAAMTAVAGTLSWLARKGMQDSGNASDNIYSSS